MFTVSFFLGKKLHGLFWAGFSGEHACQGFLNALAEMRTMLEQPHFTSRRNGTPESHSSRVLDITTVNCDVVQMSGQRTMVHDKINIFCKKIF
jgi:hypothetical protein